MATKAHSTVQNKRNTLETDRSGWVGAIMEQAAPSKFAEEAAKQAWDKWFASLGIDASRSDESNSKDKHTTEMGGELKPGEAIQLAKLRNHPDAITARQANNTHVEEAPRRRPDIAAGINYFAETFKTGEQLSRRESSEIHYKVQEIMVELKRLVDSSTILQEEFKEVTVTQAPKTPGKYHLNFFDWVLSVIRAARMKVEDSGAWLATMKGKKGKQGYWGMFKKHGTSFGMSNERAVSTQTG